MTATLDRPLPTAPTVGVGNVLASEWIKLRSVRSTYWTMFAAVLAAVGLGAAICIGYVARYNHLPPGDRFGFDPVNFSLNGLYLAQVAFGALGVLVISSEYTTGMIRTTLSAVPQRRLMLATKAGVFGAVALLCGEIMSFAAFGIGQAILASKGVGASLGDPNVLRAVVGGGLYLTAVGLLGVGLGAVIRHTAGALSALFGVMFALSAIVDVLPTSWRNDVIKYMPANAGTQIMSVQRTHDSLGPWTGLGMLTLYAFVALALGAWLLVRRDA